MENSKGIVGACVALFVYTFGATVVLIGVPAILGEMIKVPILRKIISIIDALQQGVFICTLIWLFTYLIVKVSLTVLYSMANEKKEFYIFFGGTLIVSAVLGILVTYVYVTEVIDQTKVIDVLDFLCYVMPYLFMVGYSIKSIGKVSREDLNDKQNGSAIDA